MFRFTFGKAAFTVSLAPTVRENPRSCASSPVCIKRDGGNVLLDGEPIYENAAAKGQIMFVPDELYYINGASMNRMAALYQSMYPNFNRERYNELTKELGLDPKKSLNTFSKGMRRQAITVLALAASPKYIFFDETFDGMDPVVRNYVKS